MIVDLDSLSEYDFSVFKINAVRRIPAYRKCSFMSRPKNGFIYVTHGECTFESIGERISLSAGGIVYLPFGCAHTMTIESETAEFYRIDFHLTLDKEFILFSDRPIKMTDAASPRIHEAVISLTEATALVGNHILRKEKLCAIMAELCHSTAHKYAKKLAPAIRYLEEHFTENVNCRELAALCFLSTAQFYNLFHTHFGLTPLEYRDRLLLHRAKALLNEADITVAEMASLLGFTSSAYFSRFFKKHTGLSPSAYSKKTDFSN
jgi:AraC-like DNA-binding protein